MLTNIKATIIAFVGFLFAAFGIWQVVVPIDEATVVQLVELIFIVLGSIGIGAGGVVKYILRKLFKQGEAAIFDLQVKDTIRKVK